MPDTQPALFRLRPRRLSQRRKEVVLEWIACELDRLMAEEHLSQDALRKRAKLAEGTVSRILRARNSRVSTVVDVFQALGYRIVIGLERIDPQQTTAQPRQDHAEA